MPETPYREQKFVTIRCGCGASTSIRVESETFAVRHICGMHPAFENRPVDNPPSQEKP